ncbi:MAG: SEC-C domain-containing protein [Firmicutes bacterium]|nr:SEC-C domain-containing protein [Bacillota bacterium]
METVIVNIRKQYQIPLPYGIEVILDTVHKIQKLYPYKWFTSREEIIKELKCSICGKIVNPMQPCGHIAGRVYCGELCLYEVCKLELIAIALVQDPLDKYAVIKPQGQEYNYAVLEHLMKGLSDPFEKWDYKEIKRLKPEFNDIKMKQDCPCGSGKRFKRCCYPKESSWMPHIDFVITNPKKTLGKDIVFMNSIWK